MKYKILEHPADLRLIIYGQSLEELFENAAEAIAQILSAKAAKSEAKQQAEKIKIKMKSTDLNSLLVDFLSEILTKSQINKCVYRVLDCKFRDTNIEAELAAYPVKRFDEDIKAVTYHGVDVKKNPDGVWQTELLFDI